jgi:hypothetical protein
MSKFGATLALNQRANSFFRWLFTSRYTMALEDEVERLREENRALMNSLLVRAGVQPIDPPKPVSRDTRRMSRYQQQVKLERDWIAREAKPDA